ncbi:hypothetical protein NLY43_21090 [Mesorhizobium sp. C416B]|uniref:hypothetical protein n=1 Tax=unclassified Mesorhizobium TaxID=325217 RepID=UPI0003CEBDA7|nr:MULTISPECIES: hypothetical protein [unclassified Mesorhizobium]ESX56677.1 hypothetical protein X761_09335 [Mesorhizobium sp. LSHC424B00]ESX71519.1 hypothetical protein X758_16455 [Mesorhizobium sp. LSHC416B00]WJI61105.1 hypothetical protein NLY43_21090 [Mesorhizobium sp. C416B]
MRGDEEPNGQLRRYWKFLWDDLRALPALGTVDYQPKGGAFRSFAQGSFNGEYLEIIPAVRKRTLLPKLGRCAYCGQVADSSGNLLPLSSEHVVPDFLGAGLELPSSSCAKCAKATSVVEYTISREMFGPVRKVFGLTGKKGAVPHVHFPLDIGRLTSQWAMIPIVDYPTVLVLPVLFPASSYSRRPASAADPFNFRLYNINADRALIERYALDTLSTQTVDLVRFAQMIAKIAHAYASHYWRDNPFVSTVSQLVRQVYPPRRPAIGYLEHVGCLLGTPDPASTALHEIEVGRISWSGVTRRAVRVRLFAGYGMPSYYVTISDPE